MAGELQQKILNMKEIEGFPIGKDEDIVKLSCEPEYTACPNPFVGRFIEKYGHPYIEEDDDYHREPYAADVAEDKHDLIYNIHSYHTKVPPKAIKAFIEHYTKPGDIVLDSFCGTGMTGVAAKICDDAGKAESYRHAILADLSTIAAFVAGNYNKSIKEDELKEIERNIEHLKKNAGDFYSTVHIQNGQIVTGFDGEPIRGTINYTVWSDVFICPNCSSEFVYYDTAVDSKTNKTQKEFSCPHCGLKLTKAKCVRAIEPAVDPVTGKPFEITKSVPVLINYSVNKARFNKRPDKDDLKKRLSHIFCVMQGSGHSPDG